MRTRFSLLHLALAAGLAIGAACGAPEDGAVDPEDSFSPADEPVSEFALPEDHEFDWGAADTGDRQIGPEEWDAMKAEHQHFDDPVLNPDLIVLDSRQAQHWDVYEDRIVVPIAGNEQLAAVDAGSVLIAPWLFFVKVVGVDRVGDSFVFFTEQAQITDAVFRGSFGGEAINPEGHYDRVTGEITFYDERDNPFSDAYDPFRTSTVPMPGDGFGTRADGIKISDGTVGIENSGSTAINRFLKIEASGKVEVKPITQVSFKPTFDIDGDVDWTWTGPKLQEFWIKGDARLTAAMGLEVKATAAVAGKLTIPIIPANTCYFWTFFISIFPVHVGICPGLDFEASVKVYGRLEAKAKVEVSKYVGAGLVYKKPVWYKYFNNPPVQITPTVSGQYSAGFEAEVMLVPKADISLYRLAGPYLKFGAGLNFASKCAPPTRTNTLKGVVKAVGGVKLDPKPPIPNIFGDKWDVSMSLFKWEPKIWEDTGQCKPATMILTYNRVPAVPNLNPPGRYLDLDMNVDAPPEAGGAPTNTVSRSEYKEVNPSGETYPWVFYDSLDCSGCPETVHIERGLNGSYEVWVYDYENHAQANDAFTRARAQVTFRTGQATFQTVRAPGGSYNLWKVARIQSDGQGGMTVSALNTTETRDLYPAP